MTSFTFGLSRMVLFDSVVDLRECTEIITYMLKLGGVRPLFIQQGRVVFDNTRLD